MSDASCRTIGFDAEKLAAVEPALQGFIDGGELAGVVTLTSRAGEIVQAVELGWSDIEDDRPMRSDALFRIASMTKPITSVAALMLMEEGKIGLNDPVSRWVPELAGLSAPMIHTPWLATQLEQIAAGCIIGQDYPTPIVDHAVASRSARAKFSAVRASAAGKTDRHSIVARHGSRKGGSRR